MTSAALAQGRAPKPASANPFQTKGARDAGLLLLFMTVVRVLIPFVPVPMQFAGVANIFATFVFMICPVVALVRAAEPVWSRAYAWAFLIGGVAIQVGLTFAAFQLKAGAASVVLTALAQAGLMFWCSGVGALLSSILSDKNLLVPLAIFLAVFDIWLVFSPDGFVHQAQRSGSQVLATVAYTLPKVESAVATVRTAQATAQAYVGPADLLFLSMFFTALSRFGMRLSQTARVMAPVLLGYLVVVLAFPTVSIGPISLGALPALVPIGIVVLIVNWPEFRLSADEKRSSAVLLVLCVGVLLWRFSVNAQARPTAPSRQPSAQERQALPAKPAPGDPGLPNSAVPVAPKSTPGPR